MTNIFITATDTDVGKTTISALLCLHYGCSYHKVIQSGDLENSDSMTISQLVPNVKIYPEQIKLKKSLSPNLSAEFENKEISLSDFNFDLLSQDNVIIEGVGGILVPLSDKLDIIDLIEYSGMVTLLVVPSRLGMINQARMALNLLKNRNINIIGFVTNGEYRPDDFNVISRLTDTNHLFHIPTMKIINHESLKSLKIPTDLFCSIEKNEHLGICKKISEYNTNNQLLCLNLCERDSKMIWHPYTQHGIESEFKCFISGSGSFLIDEEGNKWLDLISSWWVITFGHCDKKLSEAITKQVKTLDHIVFAGYTHEPAIKLAEMLLDLNSQYFHKVFYSDNGSTAIEVALKAVIHYYQNRGQRNRISWLALEGGYHGDTFGAMSVGYSSNYFKPYYEFLFQKIHFIPYPESYDDTTEEQWQIDCELSLNKAKYIISFIGKENIAGMIIEPLIQGASGMRQTRPEFLNKLLSICKDNEIIVIFDEIFTGFGRTGTLFAYQQLKYIPDILCLSKGITGGVLPLSVTLFPQYIYDAFVSDNISTAFIHGHSFTANPISCSAAIANLSRINSENTFALIQKINDANSAFILELKKKFEDRIYNYFTKGPLCVFSLKDKYENYGLNFNIIIKKCLERKYLIIRPLGNRIYLLPPYEIDIETLQQAHKLIIEALFELNI
ncbi:adenosylmethionine-8-amino-7-oxononanoate aminotransferase family protein [Cryptosporidium muris RN66]|uniref:Adenosylmethionine-8-amino-7-oxononanoate aminotransferase family protein n=1 Tax=Cryptosporidium muris (strain RN66) TaxID=441375 RepID=B6ABQ4_CRYMR|nr:adenosylmethionine-8-amino-7-oxononanoate aminotransferase family protein [Cryptosporidium muris RN66]EEA05806.1 adenosylmethionine-8-amino-7-oxononanoate aminotransferase family protein [Cryptosporidium muris RN66]DAA33947.1 TPA_inf: bifunctional dethiobiotin synthetase/adenosylmethionine-8-amino-7-oxononanoate aminotransferase [Cryptosporidium muris RN66]|eukprot:XP_002140155.1 adenosylmethionine-8-amino-7-oxononanoate aminotransferase family protein [Cryptosporidium muris RN66]